MSFNPNDYLIKLKGKDYLEVKWRLVWFRDDNDPKDGTSITISTEIVQDDGEQGLVKAVAYDGNGRVLATGHKREHKREFHDYIEKAETGSIGRVLAILGYGTQFAEELELPEGKLVDTPVEFPNRGGGKGGSTRQTAASAPTPNAREAAKAKAAEAAKAREAAKAEKTVINTPSTDGLPFDEQTIVEPENAASDAQDDSAVVVEPINESQVKAIGNMLKILARKKKDFDEVAFKAELAGRFGKAELEELTFEQGKQIIPMINEEMRKQQ